MLNFREMVAYIANTLIFILSGVVIAEGILGGDGILKHEKNVWGYLILLYVLLLLSRAIVVGSLYPLLSYCGYGLDWKEAIVLVWSGLRGAVALSLSLSVKATIQRHIIIHYSGNRNTGIFVFFTGGIVFLTLIVNGSTTQFVLRMLKMDKLSAAKTRILEYTKYEMMSKALEAFGDLVDDEELGPADWPTVKKYIPSLQDSEGERMHPHTSIENDNNVEHMHLSDIRIRFLNGRPFCVLIYLPLCIPYLIPHGVRCASCLLGDVRASYYKFLQSTTIPRKLVTYFTVERLESACYISAAFLRAHRIARQQLHDFIGDSEIALAIINESEREGEEAKKFLEDVRTTFPQWDSKKIKKRYSLHPTFAHGSTLGLYEVLTGKRYMCDIITDSVVLGFFIEAEKILSVLGTDDAVDDFLWQISNERHSPHNGAAKPSETPSHSKSYPRVPPTERRGLLSVRSEGSTTVRKTVNTGSESLIGPDDRNDGHEMDYSSDESGGEDEHIVRIDSPSTLSFSRAP
ncbi:hypothetical protein M8C21_000736 [Ambrosia artemisiifolia]|uniref:Cation/H+ exchanger transmembrane domain-containing protein n=1 Tax=Ambrosia artemisiifolia TaxID=4212 RepID=A0AAD5CKI9_AMBAR|nr:hypothetical protein M8C21_000736 [Ambrosia artemisiifolia]